MAPPLRSTLSSTYSHPSVRQVRELLTGNVLENVSVASPEDVLEVATLHPGFGRVAGDVAGLSMTERKAITKQIARRHAKAPKGEIERRQDLTSEPERYSRVSVS